MIKSTVFLTMTDGTNIALHKFVPEGEVKACVQLSHGMAEYAMRYEPLAERLCNEGFVLYAHDHRGHGETAGSIENLGYLADKDGFRKVKEDLSFIINQLKADFPEKKVFLLGHSFGSFISQLYIEENGLDIDGVILSGTAGPRHVLIFFARIMAAVTSIVSSKKKKSKFLSLLAFGSYTKRIKNPQSPFAWLSSDPAQVAKYDSSDYCGFLPTVSFFQDLFYGLQLIHKSKKIKEIPHTLPVYFIAGTDDPVGNYTKTIQKLINIYRQNGISDLSSRFFTGGRHEMLNEVNHTEVEDNILRWLNKHI